MGPLSLIVIDFKVKGRLHFVLLLLFLHFHEFHHWVRLLRILLRAVDHVLHVLTLLLLDLLKLFILFWVLIGLLGGFGGILFHLNLLSNICVLPILLKAACFNRLYLFEEHLVRSEHLNVHRFKLIVRAAKRHSVKLNRLLDAVHADIVSAGD